mmetsp:Transcript_14120/g.29557  ORF Transcript_14120/g.29557 Transcript_14120/m.29557 type:complete len:290 (-) Transcript_14120:224-1093(-)
MQAQSLASNPPSVKLLRCDVAGHLHVPLRGLQVLAEGDDLHAIITEVSQRLVHLLIGLAEAQHERGLRYKAGLGLPRMPEHGHRLRVPSAAVPHCALQALDRLHVVRIDVHAALDDLLHQLQAALEVATQSLNTEAFVPALQLAHRRCHMPGPLVWKVVAVDHREHNVVHAPFRHSLCHLLRLIGLRRRWPARGGHGAEAATACASVTHDHDRGSAAGPTLAHVWAAGFLADGGEATFFHTSPHLLVPLRILRVQVRIVHLQPRRFPNHRRSQPRGPRGGGGTCTFCFR